MKNIFTAFVNRTRTSFRTLWSQEDTKENISFLRSGLQWIIFCYGIDKYVLHFSMTYGPSMMPTVNEMGDILVVEKLSPRFSWWHPLHRNDIIVADSHYKTNFTICKRIIGLPGDIITPPHWHHSVPVPPDHVWIEGDNPLDSEDSRSYGPIPIGLVRGRVIAKIWPFWEAKWLLNRDEPILLPATSTTRTHHTKNSAIVHCDSGHPDSSTNDTLGTSTLPSTVYSSSPRPTANTVWREQMKNDPVLVSMVKKDIEHRKEVQRQRTQEKVENQRIQALALETFLQALERDYVLPMEHQQQQPTDETLPLPSGTDSIHGSSNTATRDQHHESHIPEPYDHQSLSDRLNDDDKLHEEALTQALAYPLHPYESSTPSPSSRLQ